MNSEHFSDEKLRGILNQKVTSKVSSIGRDLMEFRSSFQQSAQTIIDSVGTLMGSLEDELMQAFRAEIVNVEELVRGRLEPELRERFESEARQRYDHVLQEELNAARKAVAEAEHRKFQSKVDVLSGALHEICQLQAQVEILTCFLDKVAIFAERVAFFVVKSGSIVGWQARGFEGEFRNESVRSLVFPPHVNNVFKQVADFKIPFRGSPLSQPELNEVVLKFGSALPEVVYVAPLVVRGKTVALLYADSGKAGSAGLDPSALDILVTGVSLTVELSSARAKLGIKPSEAHAEGQAQAAPSGGGPIPEKPVSAVPPPEPPKPPSAKEEQTTSDAGVLVETAVGLHISHETVVTEPAPKTRAEVPRPAEPFHYSPPPVQEPTLAATKVTPPPSIETLSEPEQKLHNDARRFARLLVSEIKLYNEQKVLEGRRGKNLYDLLRDDIDKSREMYDKRVAPEVASNVDYFYEELVRILAENQVQALGRDCPGPVILK